jgi:ParB/RepB/Spo0J family partition protein
MEQYDENKVYDIPLSDILVDEDFNCRGYINPMDVIDLSRDVKEKGLHTPVFLEPWDKVPGKKFRLVAGYRRYKAHMLNEQDEKYQETRGDKAHTIRALIKSGLSDIDARIMNLSENLHRQNLNMKQEAHALESFKNFGWSEVDAANKLKMSRGWVQVRYMLLELPDDIQNEAAAGMLSQHQIRHVYSLRENPDAAYDYVRAVKEKRLLGKKREPKPEDSLPKSEKKIRTEAEIFKLQDEIRELFGNNFVTKVLGWAGGVIEDYDIYEDIRQQALSQGKFYMIPEFVARPLAPAVHPEESNEPEPATD